MASFVSKRQLAEARGAVLAEEFHLTFFFKKSMTEEEQTAARKLLDSPGFRHEMMKRLIRLLDEYPELNKTFSCLDR